MKHTISRTILTISLALCAAHLGLAQTSRQATTQPPLTNHKTTSPEPPTAFKRSTRPAAAAKTPARSFATRKRRKRIFQH